MRVRGRFARTMLRGTLMIGGVLAAWGVAEATAEEAAFAAGPPRLCTLGDLLDSAVVGGSLSCAASSPADRGPAAIVGGGVGTATPGTTGGIAPPARTSVGISVRVPTGSRLAQVRAPVRRAVDATPSAGVDPVAEAVEPVTRRVVGDAPPVVRETAEAGLLERVGTVVRPVVEPVGTVVRPVVEPVVEALAPTLAPVLELTEPVIGPPAAPSPPAGDPVDDVPAPAEDVPAVTAPATDGGPVPGPPTRRGVMPRLPSSAATTSPATTGEPRSAGAPGAGATEASHPLRQSSPAHTPGVTPAASGSSASNGSAGGWAGTAADTAPGSWTPDLRSQGWCATRCEELADRPRQPDTRPA
ncbi:MULTISPECIES: hypothetical protein [unclassified Micromonospora]|uniref:hypothetical protein n=1 Tax=unclassified Micromonospora TaxID=2617518 RepID=UPI00332D7CB4